jgi:hypothetical protein
MDVTALAPDISAAAEGGAAFAQLLRKVRGAAGKTHGCAAGNIEEGSPCAKAFGATVAEGVMRGMLPPPPLQLPLPLRVSSQAESLAFAMEALEPFTEAQLEPEDWDFIGVHSNYHASDPRLLKYCPEVALLQSFKRPASERRASLDAS